MRSSLILIICFYGLISSAQTFFQGVIKDSKTKLPLEYCPVGIKHKNKTCLTNEDGVFQISAGTNDTLIIRFIGYQDKQILVSQLVINSIIFLDEKEIKLQEVIVTDKKDFLSELVEKCKTNLKNSKPCKSKAYYVLRTNLTNQPAELRMLL